MKRTGRFKIFPRGSKGNIAANNLDNIKLFLDFLNGILAYHTLDYTRLLQSCNGLALRLTEWACGLTDNLHKAVHDVIEII